MSSTTDFE